MAHPAKFSSKLIRRIYEHMIEQEWLKPGDKVIDPFGGVSLGALDAMRLGLDWTGVELEERFVGLGTANILNWNNRFGSLPRWGSARLLQGDSRRLLEIVGSAQAAVSSPPYAESDMGKHGEGPQGGARLLKKRGNEIAAQAIGTGYGNAAGQLGAMKADGFEAAISSPPFMGQTAGNQQREQMRNEKLANSREKDWGDYDEKIPFEKRGFLMGKEERKTWLENCNLGSITTAADDFWLSARAIVEQVYLSLTPGGHACWVVKDYVKNKQIVPFCNQWRQLCEAVGFETLHEHHASLIRNQRTQHTLDGGHVKMQAESKSFFRRLAEKNGSPRIDYETVFCMVKHG